jgi:hypothetical protein
VYPLKKTRAAGHANSSPGYRPGFVSAADPIICLAAVDMGPVDNQARLEAAADRAFALDMGQNNAAVTEAATMAGRGG